ncbi:MAG TPA: sigma-54 dependent transcriptional regulator [Myxococcales bacterium]|nr:sigma-54 dependent transcriptional regulator [Myxococcales bacterium]
MRSCENPFERGALCRLCSASEPVLGMRFCSRVVAGSPAMRAVIERASAVARTDAPVVILGESGSGKEVLARAIHANGARKKAPFLAVNVAALPSELLESELFGHVRGAFTGATASTHGLFQAASGGTLFLDEIAEMSLPLQAKLLRVLQDGEVRRVGETRTFSVDTRIFCATHRDLRKAVAEGRFREDLYYRLKVFTLEVPPLRRRSEDILPLAEMFLRQEKHPTSRFTEAAERALLAWPWPGNVRELLNAARHGALFSEGQDVDVAHLPPDMLEAHPPGGDALRSLAEVEREHILRVLQACGGRQADAARILGIGRTTLWRKLQELDLDSGRAAS